MMLGMLAEKGYCFTDDELQADIVVVNTCCFRKGQRFVNISGYISLVAANDLSGTLGGRN